MQRALLLLLLVLLLPISPASADPIPVIVIQQGSVIVRSFGGFAAVDIDARGTRDFLLDMHGNSVNFGANCLPCFPGRLFNFGAPGLDEQSGSAELGGVSFSLSSFADNLDTAVALTPFVASAILPPPNSVGVISMPFIMDGLFRILHPGRDPQPPAQQEFRLVGQGTATVTLDPDAPGLWRFGGSRFDFEVVPTPEPTTLLLLSSGLAGAAWTRRRSRIRTCMH
jgi:hypothetical protein